MIQKGFGDSKLTSEEPETDLSHLDSLDSMGFGLVFGPSSPRSATYISFSETLDKFEQQRVKSMRQAAQEHPFCLDYDPMSQDRPNF